MYQAVAYQRSKNIVHIWDDQHGHIQVPYKKYAYKKNSHGKYSALDGNRVEKVTSWDESDIQRGLIYESDLDPETRTLIDMYTDSDDISTNHRILNFDIECNIDGGYGTTEDPWQPLTSISLKDKSNDRLIAIIVDKDNKIQSYKKPGLILDVVSNETDLLIKFLQYYQEIRPTILTGWNIDYFDIPYMYQRMVLVLGEDYANSLSPIGEVTYNKNNKMYKIAGVSSLDYQYLYKLFTQNEEVSYTLDAISKKELGKGKVVYEGNLNTLYTSDIVKFIEYNVTDVLLVDELDEKLKYITLAMGMCHKGHVAYENIYQTSKYLDGACLTYMKRIGVIAPNRPVHESHSEDDDDDEESDDSFAGAYVKDPIPGLYEWVFDEDMKALYPNNIRSLNISPETKVGRIENFEEFREAFVEDSFTAVKAKINFIDYTDTILASELRAFLTDNNYSISPIGVIYDLKKQGIVPAILEAWTNEREEFRALVKKYAKAGDKTMAEFFDNRQQVAKRMNNSLYGVLGLPGFRFHDVDNAESITQVGVKVVQHAVKVGNDWFVTQTKKYHDYNIYVDTDSCFFSAVPVIEIFENKFGRSMTDEEKANITFKTAETIEKVINESFTDFALKNFNITSHKFEIKQEYVASAGFWVARKRYAQRIISEKGVSIFEITGGAKSWKLDVKGMDVVRSDFPKLFREYMSKILISILEKAPRSVIDDLVLELKDNIKTAPMLDIMFPRGVKQVSKYQVKRAKDEIFTKRLKGTPIHVKSALNYNDLLVNYASNVLPIKDGEKIRWTYLRKNPYCLDTCAIRGYDDPQEITKFISDNIDYDRIFESSLHKKLTSFYDALGYGPLPKDKNLETFFSF